VFFITGYYYIILIFVVRDLGYVRTIIELMFLRTNQIQDSLLFYKTHKHYNYLQSILKQKLFTKVVKNAKIEKGWVERCKVLFKEWQIVVFLPTGSFIEYLNEYCK
jgi:hypothetical protein